MTTGLRAFQKVGLNIDGLVLSQVSPKEMKRYGYGQDYGTYAAAGYYDN
ncbi:hypothetical protein [Thalassobium sp. R2A62]|nr:hypothetical protein [Thalassobium sp. R2A62]EET49307.1 hypothetical protein TR2A62_2379 [Thalassobium sp. R2A62]